MSALDETVGHDPLVLDLADAGPRSRELFGAADDLARLHRLGLPVPPGCVITTAACAGFLEGGCAPEGLWSEVTRGVERIEVASGLRLGDPERPLLLHVEGSVGVAPDRGIVTGIGMNDEVQAGLAARGAGCFARTTYAALVLGYGRLVLGVGPAHFDPDDVERALLPELAGEDLPHDPLTQLRRVVDALAMAWLASGPSRSTHTAGTQRQACVVTITQLVSGERGPRSGAGVVLTRDPVTGAPGAVGDHLPGARSGSAPGGAHGWIPFSQLQVRDPAAHAQLLRAAAAIEADRRDVREFDYVVEEGRLWVTADRPARPSAAAAFRIASDLVDEGVIDLDEALRRVRTDQLEILMRPVFRRETPLRVLARGLALSPGAAVGELVLDRTTALTRAAHGVPVVLAVVHAPADEADTVVAVLTGDRGRAQRVAGLCRQLGRPCVALDGMGLDPVRRTLTLPDGSRLDEGAIVSVDGTSGLVSEGRRDTGPSAVSRALSRSSPTTVDPVVAAVLRILEHADRCRRLEVHANAETPEDARIARRLGAEGIGLLRTEHLLLGPRRQLIERLVTDEERDDALDAIEALTFAEFTSILEAMDDLPVVVRLLDPPLDEFLPDLVDLSVQTALAEEHGQRDERLSRRLLAVQRWSETNPLLGLRGVRILTVLPQIVDVQVRALARATVTLLGRGRRPRPEVMVPLVADVAELAAARTRIERIIGEVGRAHGVALDLPVGVMIELPRAALTASEMARAADFFSFGTNDLTQTCWGISPDDAEASFMRTYRETGILTKEPFVTIDEPGVGRLVRLAVDEGRATRPGLRMGVCGRHAEDPASVGFFADLEVDYVSCPPGRIPVIRLEAGRQAVLGTGTPASRARAGRGDAT